MIKTKPLKALALFSLLLIVLLTGFFYRYNEQMLTTTENVSSKIHPVTGILLPENLLTESSLLKINFANNTRSVSLEELRKGYVISPEKLLKCTGDTVNEDQAKFIISLVIDRLYIKAAFKSLWSDTIAASVDQQQWTPISKEITGFYSDDNSFVVSDAKGNIVFNLNFSGQDTLFIQGYFSGKKCIYVAGRDVNYSDVKTGNYVQRAEQEIKKIK